MAKWAQWVFFMNDSIIVIAVGEQVIIRGYRSITRNLGPGPRDGAKRHSEERGDEVRFRSSELLASSSRMSIRGSHSTESRVSPSSCSISAGSDLSVIP